MRSAARTALAAAVLAGALLAPTGSAFAATPARPAAASSTVPDRYAGTPVLISEGVVAVLRNKSEGPEAWVRAVPKDWKQGDSYMGRVLAVVDVKHPTATVDGLRLRFVEEDVHHPLLSVTKDGKTTTHPFPKGQGPECLSEPVRQSIGAGAVALLMTGPNGPVAQLEFAEEGEGGHTSLTRANPSLPKGAGIVARILNPSSAKPVFEWKTQGGSTPYGHATFPALPKGCTFDFTFQPATQKPQPETKPSTGPSAKPSATTPTGPKTQTVGQTSVVPKGGVAAGAVVPAAAPAPVAPVAAASTTGDTNSATTVAAGAALIAAFGALGASVVLRRRRAQG
ncbi:hypothetical protein ACFYYB_16255 [Streptomyces sp. NPDC002886]|uniref:hypothetical protein n=1 Tax=Streptomyces sp. NPDC002886 TaxID=3364667 RepID=UPI003679D49A